MRTLYIATLLLTATLPIGLSAQADKPEAPSARQEQHAADAPSVKEKQNEKNIARAKEISRLKGVLSTLKPTDVVLEIGGQTAIWRELYPSIQPEVDSLLDESKEVPLSTVATIRSAMQKIVTRRMFAMEAQKQGLIPNAEERKAIVAEIENNLKTENGKYKTLQQYITSFELKEPNLLNVSFDDIVNIMFLNKKLFSDIKATDQEVQLYVRYKKAVANSIDKLNIKRREAMDIIAKSPVLLTDEGFARVAKEFSEGEEARQGGEIKEFFTREELAEFNQIKEFNWKEGEVTPVLETDTAYRIMKIIKVIPGETPDAPEKIQVAQILCGKVGEAKNLNNTEAIRELISVQKQKAFIEAYAFQMSQDYNVKTMLFPDGLWDKNQKSPFAVVNPAAPPDQGQ